MDLNQCYEILGVEQGATRFEVRQAYHDLLHVWEPGRIGKNLRLKKRAMEQIAQINEAYETLEASLPKPPATPAPADGASLEMVDDEDTPPAPRMQVSPPMPTLDIPYVPDGPPPPEVPLTARLREARAQTAQTVAKGIATAIPFSRKNVFLACIIVVSVPVSAFFIQQYFRGDRKPVIGDTATPRPGDTATTWKPPVDTPPATMAAPEPATAPAAIAQTQPTAATVAAAPPGAPPEAPVVGIPADPPQDAAMVQRATTLAELAKLHLTPASDATQEQLDALLVRANMAHELEASGYKLDPQKASLDLLKEYLARVEMAHQIEQLAGIKIKPADFTPSQLRDLRARATLVQQIAQNGYKIDINRYNLTELADLVRSSEIAKELRTKYSVNVDIATHSLNELEEILRAAQNQKK